MSKHKPDPTVHGAVTTSEAPETATKAAKPAAKPAEAPVLHGYADRGEGLAIVTLKGLYDDAGGQYRVYAPIPQDISNGGVTYDLHDRATGVYHQRVK